MTDATATEPTKLWFLLDRSGSMSSLSEDVIGGFNTFVSEQAGESGSAHLTLVQFDSDGPFDIVHDAVHISDISPLTTDIYQPRGLTPLLDAIGDLITHADQRFKTRSQEDRPTEDQLIVIFSDGMENASSRYNRASVTELIRERQEAGWEFVFMGANQDSYLEAGRIGFSDESVSNFAATATGTSAAFQSISRATTEYREKTRIERTRDRGKFYGGTREAEMGGRAEHRGGPERRKGIPNLERASVGPIHKPSGYLALPRVPVGERPTGNHYRRRRGPGHRGATCFDGSVPRSSESHEPARPDPGGRTAHRRSPGSGTEHERPGTSFLPPAYTCVVPGAGTMG